MESSIYASIITLYWECTRKQETDKAENNKRIKRNEKKVCLDAWWWLVSTCTLND